MAGAMDVGTVGASTFSSGFFVGVVRDKGGAGGEQGWSRDHPCLSYLV